MRRLYIPLALLLILFPGLSLPLSLAQSGDRPQAFEPTPERPAGPVRAMAEWEEIEYLVITWTRHLSTLREITRHAREVCKVLIICKDSLAVKHYLKGGSVALGGISYLQAPYNSVWVRDYGPQSVYTQAEDALSLIEWDYNRPRPWDDLLPWWLADYLGVPLYKAHIGREALIHTGGNFLTDGLGTAFSSDLIVQENVAPGGPLSREELDSLMQVFMGIDRFITLRKLPYDRIHHLDMHLKLLDEETLLVGSYPEGIADGPQIEANLSYLKQQVPTVFGNTWRIVRTPMPPYKGHYPDTWWAPYRTYTNCVFLNELVLVPTYQCPSDSVALRIIGEALPGHRIVGIDCKELVRAGGAIHCITHTIGVTDPLPIIHARLRDTVYRPAGYQVRALARHRSGIGSMQLYYAAEGESEFHRQDMVQDTLQPDYWVGTLPAYPAGSKLRYYLEALPLEGRARTRPLAAPRGYWPLRILTEAESKMR